MPKTPTLHLRAVNLDCDDATALAHFYSRATGYPMDERSTKDFAAVRGVHGFIIGFQRVDQYQRPEWPDPLKPQQSHLDFEVDDLEAAEAALLVEGATKPDLQPGAHWRVLLDPAGHPFCLTQGGAHT